jgi:Bacterial Ig-like domain (group 2).
VNSIEKLIDLELSLHGTKGFIDGLQSNFLIKKCNDGSENGYNLNTLIAKVPFKQGSIVFVGNDKYIVLDIEEQFAQNIYYKGTMRKCENFNLSKDKYYTERSNVVGVVDKDKSTLISNDYFLEENTYINATIPLQQFNINDEYVLYKGKAYMIVNVDDTKEGIVTLNSKFKDRYSEVEKVYSISLKSISGTLQVGQTLQLEPICKENDVIVDNPVITYYSNDDNVASVDNKGLITCKSIGSVTITCTYEGINTTYSLEVKQEDVYTIECDNVSIFNKETYQLNPIVKINGEIIDNPTITYVVEDSSICTCSNGLVTGIGVGSTNITLSYEDKISFKVNITIKEVAVNYSIVGADSFKQLRTSSYSIEPLTNCVFYLDEFDGEYIAEIRNDDGMGTCTIYGKKNISNNYITLYAKDEKENLLAQKRIDILK